MWINTFHLWTRNIFGVTVSISMLLVISSLAYKFFKAEDIKIKIADTNIEIIETKNELLTAISSLQECNLEIKSESSQNLTDKSREQSYTPSMQLPLNELKKKILDIKSINY